MHIQYKNPAIAIWQPCLQDLRLAERQLVVGGRVEVVLRHRLHRDDDDDDDGRARKPGSERDSWNKKVLNGGILAGESCGLSTKVDFHSESSA